MDITNSLHLLCKEWEYKLTCMCNPRIKGSIALHHIKIRELKSEFCKQVQRLQTSDMARKNSRLKKQGRRRLRRGGGLTILSTYYPFNVIFIYFIQFIITTGNLCIVSH